MHENIKYSIVLDSSTQELISVAQIRDQGPKARISYWQSVLSNNAYDTHHFAYGKFIGTQQNDGFHLNLIQLFMENYTGNFTIGFNGFVDMVEIELHESDYDERYPNRKKYLLIMGMEAMKENLEDRVIMDFSPNNVILHDGDLMIATSFYTPFKPEISKIYSGNEAMKSVGIIDEMFMERIGSDIRITYEGKAMLRLLHNIVPDIITADNLRSVVDPDSTKTMSELNKVEDFIMLKNSNYGQGIHNDFPFIQTKTGISYPCIPTNSIFYTK